jgi:S-adenosylmethionine:tRNA ribosyltransferase-isomerase
VGWGREALIHETDLNEFDYHVPEELIAQEPLAERDASRMLVLHRKTAKIEHRRFLDLADYLGPKDFLVFNNTKVVRARLNGNRPSGGKVEFFLLKETAPGIFEALVKSSASEKRGLKVEFGAGLHGEILEPLGDQSGFSVRLSTDGGNLYELISMRGEVPLPPYIRRAAHKGDESRYQTIFADQPGSVAAPTAGLHFTDRALALMEKKGVARDCVTLHVGLGTFQPIKVDNVSQHKMHSEEFWVSEGLTKKAKMARDSGGRVIAVGTTTVRSLESAALGKKGSTDLYIRPGFEFHAVDAMFTNFHQPKSSLIVMLAAFVGDLDLLKRAYQEAVAARYRFFSYGDCMLVL